LSGGVSTGAGGVQLGGYPADGGYGFQGILDEPAIYRHALDAAEVANHYARRTYAQAVWADAPVAYWRLDESSGTTVADLPGTSDGSLTGGVLVGQAGALAEANRSMRFDGVDGSLAVVPNSNALLTLNGASALTVESWINPQTQIMPSGFRMFYTFPGQPGSYLGVYNSGGVMRVIVALVINGVQRAIGAGPAIAVGSWYHVVATYDGAALTLYVNGTAVGQLTGLSGPVNVGGSGVLLGGYAVTGGNWNFDGFVDEAAIYPQALTPAQVATHYGLRTLAQSTAIDLQLEAVDPDGNPITYGATGLPPDLAINTSTGRITGTLTPASVGTHSVTVTATDGSFTTSRSFIWTVTLP
jgi:hypothetical protein